MVEDRDQYIVLIPLECVDRGGSDNFRWKYAPIVSGSFCENCHPTGQVEAAVTNSKIMSPMLPLYWCLN